MYVYIFLNHLKLQLWNSAPALIPYHCLLLPGLCVHLASTCMSYNFDSNNDTHMHTSPFATGYTIFVCHITMHIVISVRHLICLGKKHNNAYT